jgi:RNA polymerase sigma-70 factor (ECF subfamily)
MASEQRLQLVCELLTRIDLDRRAVLIMYDLLDVPVTEIARDLQLKEGTVRSRLRLAREDFRVAVKRLRAEDRRALSLAGILGASEPLRSLEPEALLHAARVVPAVPVDLQLRVWAALQREIASTHEAAQEAQGFTPALLA